MRNVWKVGVTHSDPEFMIENSLAYAYGDSMPTYLSKSYIGNVRKDDIIILAKSMQDGIRKVGVVKANPLFCLPSEIEAKAFIDKGISKSGNDLLIAKFKELKHYDIVYFEVQWLPINTELIEVNFNNTYGFTSVKDSVLISQIVEKLINMEKYINLLKANKNIVLTGAPGTGKTYLAKELAAIMKADTEFVQFHPSYDYTDFVEGLRPIKKGESELGFELKDGIFKSFCKKALKNLIDSKKSKEVLKAELSLEESLYKFIEKVQNDINANGNFPLNGIGGACAPIIDIDEFGFTVLTKSKNKLTTPLEHILLKYEAYKDGADIKWSFKEVTNRIASYHQTYFYGFLTVFHEYVKNNKVTIEDVEEVVKRDFVMIIDEINRGEISKIFGELFYSIDIGYRGEKGKVKTQYANLIHEGDLFEQGFYIPENVYIIGTMNDIDRSVESFDFAMRRRFTWIEIKADDRIEMLDETIPEWKDAAINKMKALNTAIGSVEGLNSSFHIGPAYFIKLKEYNGDFEQLLNYHIEPLIKEYLRGLPNADKDLTIIREAYING